MERESAWTRLRRNVGGPLDLLDVAVPVLFGTALFVSVFVVAPLWLMQELFEAGRVWLAGALAFVEAATAYVIVRDLRSRQLSSVTKVVGGIWLLCIGWVVLQLMLV